MRLVPGSPSLKLTLLICSTNWGSSMDGGNRGSPDGNHSTARPSLPAIAVNVPHSWAVRSGALYCSSAVRRRAKRPTAYMAIDGEAMI